MLAALAAPLLTALWAVGCRLRGDRGARVPHGPSMCVAAAAAVALAVALVLRWADHADPRRHTR